MFELRRMYEVDLTVQFLDDRNEPAPVEGDPLWTSSDAAILAIVPGANPFSVILQALGPVGGAATWQVSADADLGEGVEPVVASDQVNITSGQAVSASTTYGEPRPIG